MPVKQRARKRKRKPDILTEEQKVELLEGFTLFGDSHFESQEACREAWLKHQEELMATWLQEPGKLGKRPEA